jgi:hypothetical protein
MKLKQLSPSSSHRFFICKGSVWETLFAPAVDTEEERGISLEGSAAHKLLELSVKSRKNPLTFIGKTVQITKPEASWEITEEMAEHIAVGFDLILEKSGKGQLMLEQYVPIMVQGVQCGGTLDAGWYGLYDRDSDDDAGPRRKNTKKEWQLHLLDLKYGYKEVADPGDNTQLRIYTSSLVRTFLDKGKKIDSVHLWIFQPRVDSPDGPFKHDILHVDDIHAFELDLAEVVQEAKNPKAKRIPGSHCLYCGGLATCAEAEKATLRTARLQYNEKQRERVGDLLFLRPQVLSWAKAVYDLGTSMGLHGKPPEGWVLGNGRRSKRWVGDKTEWFRKLGPKLKSFGLKEEEYAPRKLASPAKVVALAGKNDKLKDKIGKLWFWTQGKQKLQPAANARNRISVTDYFEEHDYGDESDDDY